VGESMDFLEGMDDDDIMDALGAMMGDDDDDDMDELGRRGRRRKSRTLAAFKRANLAPGVPRTSRKRQPLGLGTLVFNTGSGTTQTATVSPQKPVFIKKLVADVVRDGASATGAVTIDEISVGTSSQFASDDPVPASLFGETTQENQVFFDQASPGTTVTIRVSVSAAPTASDSITVNLGSIVETLG
jgi:hypothetical protein